MAVLGMALKKEIDKKAVKIIEIVQSFADANTTQSVLRANPREGKKQFTDLVEAAAQSCCIEEFKLYIQYKGSKEGTRKFWERLAAPLNEKVELIKGIADGICQSLPDEDKETVRLEVLKRFCGYLMWREHTDISKA